MPSRVSSHTPSHAEFREHQRKPQELPVDLGGERDQTSPWLHVSADDAVGVDVGQGSSELPHHPASQRGRQDATRSPVEEGREVHVRRREHEGWQVSGVLLSAWRRGTDVHEPDDVRMRHFAQDSGLP